MRQFRLTTQGQAEDIVLWHRYNYYVLGCALISDAKYDALEQAVRSKWSVCVCGIGGCIGSDDAQDYPVYVQDGRAPLWHERLERDRLIAERWLANI